MAEGRQIDLSTMGVEELTNLKTQLESVRLGGYLAE